MTVHAVRECGVGCSAHSMFQVRIETYFVPAWHFPILPARISYISARPALSGCRFPWGFHTEGRIHQVISPGALNFIQAALGERSDIGFIVPPESGPCPIGNFFCNYMESHQDHHISGVDGPCCKHLTQIVSSDWNIVEA